MAPRKKWTRPTLRRVALTPRALRTLLGWTQQRQAQWLNVAVRTVARWERVRRMPVLARRLLLIELGSRGAKVTRKRGAR
jgi:DNA-binding transcriptional regulator YiaG